MPFGGDCRHVICDRGNILYAALLGGGIYSTSDRGENWKRIGFSISAINCAMVSRNNHLFFGTNDSGILRTTNGGKDWKLLQAGLPRLRVLAMAEGDSGTVYIGTTRGMYRSRDEGESWARLPDGSTDSVFVSVAVGPGGTLYAGKYRGGLYVSSDGGNGWTRSLGYGYYQTIAFNSKGIIFATGFLSFKSTDGGASWLEIKPADSVTETVVHDDILYALTGDNRLLKSTDDGVTWELVPTQIPASSFAIDSLGMFYSGTMGFGVSVSTDGGVHWVLRGIEPITNVAAIVPNDRGDIFISANGTFRSTDEGANWIFLNGITFNFSTQHDRGLFLHGQKDLWRSTDQGQTWNEIRRDQIFTIAFNAKGEMFLGSNGNVQRSSDDGKTWKQVQVSAKGSGEVRGLLVNPNGNLIAGTTCSNGIGLGGIFRSFNNGETWDNPDNRFQVYGLCMNRMGKMFAATYGDGIYQSKDEGLHWDQVKGVMVGNPIRQMVMDEAETLIAGTERGLWQSSDQGKNWTLSLDGSIRYLGRGTNGYLYVATADGKLYKSVETVSPPRPPVLVSPANNATCASTMPDVFWSAGPATDRYQLQVATDETFSSGIVLDDSLVADTTRRVAGLADTTRYFWRARGRNVAGWGDWSETRRFTTLGSAIQSVLLQSPPNGASVPWRNVVMHWSSVPCVSWYQIQVARDSLFQDMVIADTCGSFYQIGKLEMNANYYWRVRSLLFPRASAWSGISRFTTDAPTVIDGGHPPADIAITDPFPNPFSGSTTLRYTLPKRALVTVKVYNLLGRTVASMLEDVIEAGGHELRISSAGLHNGVFFCRIAVEGKVILKKLVVRE